MRPSLIRSWSAWQRGLKVGGPIREKERLREAHELLLKNDEYHDAVVRSTGDEAKVKTRMRLATDHFSKVT